MSLSTMPRQQSPEIAALFNVEQILQRLRELPGEIRKQQQALAEAKDCLQEAEEELKLAEGMLVTLIASEKDPRNGKARYSNQAARDAELAKRKASDPDYQTALKAYKQAQQAVDSAKFDLDAKYNEFSAIKAAAEVSGSYMRLMAAS